MFLEIVLLSGTIIFWGTIMLRSTQIAEAGGGLLDRLGALGRIVFGSHLNSFPAGFLWCSQAP